MSTTSGSDPLATVDDVLITAELANRPSRTLDHEIESQALGLLAQEMAGNPRNVLQKCAELVMKLCHADSAGISVLEPGRTGDMLRWRAAAGAFAPNLNGTMPRDASPCGTVMERNCVLLFNEAERFFPALQGVEPRIYENLLAPWHVEGKAVGTLWAIKHTAEGRFDAEDARILQSLARFAAAAFQMISALDEATAERSAVRELEKRQSFLLELSDALRPVSEAREVQAMTTRLVGTHLGADRVMYAEVEGKPGAETGTIHAQFVRRPTDGSAPVARFPDHFTFDPFGAHTMEARYRGDPLVVTDVASDPAFGVAERAAWQKADACAAIVAPLSKGGRLVAEFGVHSVGPRDWTSDDVALVQEVAERTWAAAERARAEEALRWGEEKYRTVFESMDEGFLVHEMIRNEAGKVVDYRLLEANPAHQRATGLPPETIGKLGSEFMPEVESDWLELFHRVSTSGVAERIEMYNAPTSRWYNVQVSPVRGHDRIAIVFDDITTRKQAETQLRESEERQTFLLKLSDTIRPYSDPTDIQGETTRLLREQLNAAWCYYVDWDLAKKVGRVLRDSVGEGLPSLAGAHDVSDAPEFLELLTSGKLLTVHDYAGYEQLPTRIRQQFTALGFRSMMAAPFVKGGRLIATLLVGETEVRDWSASEGSLLAEVAERTWAAIERGHAETALRESEERFQQFANASRSALWVRDSETFNFEFVSPSVKDIYGVPPEDLMRDERLLGAVILPEERGEVSERVRRISAGETIAQEYRILRATDRTFRWVRSTGFPLYSETGKVERIGGIAEDVTETKMAVEHQNVLLAELQHRVRNIMAMIRSTAVRSADGATDVEDYKTSLAGRLLALARVQTLLTRQANAGGSLRDILESEIGAQAHSEHQYELTGPDTMLSPKAVEVLTLAFHELSTNALKYGALSVRGGKVTVTWTLFEKHEKPWLAIDWAEDGAPSRPPPTRRGFGTELIEAKIPYELRGSGKTTIEPGGARCHIEFPLREAESILETDAPAPTRLYGGTVDTTGAPDLTGKIVLVVEDDYYVASDTVAALRGAGAEVLGPCPTEEEALRLLEDETPTVVVLDLNLGGGGPRFEIAHKLVKQGTPFVFLTGYDQDVIPHELADIVRLQKPIAFRDVVEAVSKL